MALNQQPQHKPQFQVIENKEYIINESPIVFKYIESNGKYFESVYWFAVKECHHEISKDKFIEAISRKDCRRVK